MEIEQVDQATVPPRALMRQFQLTPWRIVDFPDPSPQMYANFHTGSPVALANYSDPGARPIARTRTVHGRFGKAYRGLLGDQPADQQGGDQALGFPEHLLRYFIQQAEGPSEALIAE